MFYFRLTRESCQRKVSQTSADQLIEEHQFNERCPSDGGGGGPRKEPGGPNAKLMKSGMVFNTIDNRSSNRSSEGKRGDEGQFDTFPRNGGGLYSSKQKHELEQMSTFRPTQNSPLPAAAAAAQPHHLPPGASLLSPQPPPSISSTSSKLHNHRNSSCTESTSGGSVGQRSSGDGGSGSEMEVGGGGGGSGEHHLHPHHHHHHLQLPLSQNPQPSPPYAKVRVMTAQGLVEVEEEEDEEEDSHYSLIRRPDGQADELVNR